MKASDKLRILAMEFCSNSNIPKHVKIKQLEYIKEADPYVCLGYILDGKFYQLNEAGKKEIKERFLKEQGTDPHALKTSGREERKRASSIIGVATNPVGYLGYRTVKAIFSKCARKCGSFRINSPERVRCLAACKQQAKGQK